MGLVQNGLLGTVKGSVGPIVFCTLKGQQVAKAKPTKSNKPLTLKQETQTLRFGMVTEFLSHFTELIGIGYKPAKAKSSGMNAAVQTVINENVIGIYPDFQIDYVNVMLTDGKLEGADRLVITPLPEREIELAWQPAADRDLAIKAARNKDVAYVTFYDPKVKRNVVVKGLETRGDGKLTVYIPRSMNGGAVHGWLAFISEDGKQTSTSEYLGAIVPLV